MLVCSQCQFENPDLHRFCQHCGASLTEVDCSVCGAPVSLDSEYCLQCGAVTGTTWKAVLSPVGAKNVAALAAPPDASSAVALPTGKFLDSQQRYQLLEPLPQQIDITAEVEVRVLDHQPLQATTLHTRYQQSFQQALEVPLPAMASLYLDLHDQFEVHALPQIHDAWRHSGLDILLLEDRSNLPLLVDLWCDQETLLLQILHWLHEMTELWAMLESQHCTQSLLQLPNLRVDEDHLLCLQRLYPDLPDQPATLSQLGQLWQKLFQQAQRTHNAELSHLCTDLEAGTIDSVAQLRSRIEAIATALQFDHLMTSALPSPENSSVEATPAAGETDAMETIQQPSSSLPEQIVEPVEDEETGFDDLPTVVLAMQLSSLEDAGRTDIGRQRDHNEDCFSVQTEIKKLENPQGRTLQAKGLYILCDGMGGHASGEVASALAVATLQRYFAEHWQDKLPSEEAIRDAIQQANQAIFDQNQKNASAGSGRMGTTLVLLLIHDAQAAIAHVGDSRLYQLTRRRGLQQLTLDHEVGQREIQRGVEPSLAYARPDAYQLTQALGPRDENFLSPDIRFIELNEDSVLLLCSDGLSDSDLLESHWQTHLEPLLDQRLNLEQGVNQLIELANQYNGHDNITAIAVRLKVRPNLDQYSRTVV